MLHLSESEAGQFELSSYVLIARTHHCKHCFAVQNWSDLHEVWTHPTKTALTNAKILKAAAFVAPGYDIATVNTPIITVPICHECADKIDESHNANRVFPALSYSAWADTLQRKAKEAIIAKSAAQAAARRSTPEPGLDSI